jgi:hypothetical protein
MNCDKCGKSVSYKDDAVVLDSLYYAAPIWSFFACSRHIKCSPSRNQFILIKPFGVPDSRPKYDKRNLPFFERIYKEIGYTICYWKLQRKGEK